MNEAKIQWQKLVDTYISTYSPFQRKELVYIINQGFKNPYEIQNIEIDRFGDFKYTLNSPRSHSTLPIKYTVSQLSKESLVILNNEER